MKTIRVGIFDWNGNLERDIASDALRFRFAYVPVEKIMGHVVYDLIGEEADLQSFLDFYELETE